VLPTGRTARFASGLSVYTFLRSCAVIKAEKSFYARNGRLMEILAESEGLSRHCKSLSLRKKKKQ
jgi:histidinol dehydrogenase